MEKVEVMGEMTVIDFFNQHKKREARRERKAQKECQKMLTKSTLKIFIHFILT